MIRPQEPHKPLFPIVNPLRMMRTKGSYVSPDLQALLNNFEGTLAERLRKLKPKEKNDVFCFSWMILATRLLSETHNDIIALLTDLKLPVYDWDDKWIDVYLDNTVKLLDICIAFSSELSRLSQGKLLLQCVLHNLGSKSHTELHKAKSSIDSWRHQIGTKNPRFDNCFTIINKLMESLEFPKIKNSAKGKVLMRAMYGVKVQTVFVCSVFISAFTGSDKKLIDSQIAGTHLWANSFNDLRACVNGEIRNFVSSGRNTLLKDLEEVDNCVKELYQMVEDGKKPVITEAYQNCVEDLGTKAEKVSSGLDLLCKEVDGFFQIVLSGRDALLCNLRVCSGVYDSPKKYKVKNQLVR